MWLADRPDTYLHFREHVLTKAEEVLDNRGKLGNIGSIEEQLAEVMAIAHEQPTPALRPSIPFMTAGFAILGVALACATPGINGSASLTVEPHEQGAAAGYLAAANTSGAILGPILGTSLYQLQPNAPMLIGGVLMVIVSIYALTIPAPQPQGKE